MAAPAAPKKTLDDVFKTLSDLALQVTGQGQILGQTSKDVSDQKNIQLANATGGIDTQTLLLIAGGGLLLFFVLKK